MKRQASGLPHSLLQKPFAFRRRSVHKLSTRRVPNPTGSDSKNKNQMIPAETSNIQGMVKNRRLAKVIHAAACGELIRQSK